METLVSVHKPVYERGKADSYRRQQVIDQYLGGRNAAYPLLASLLPAHQSYSWMSPQAVGLFTLDPLTSLTDARRPRRVQCFQCCRVLGLPCPKLQTHSGLHHPPASQQYRCPFRSVNRSGTGQDGVLWRIFEVPRILCANRTALSPRFQHRRFLKYVRPRII